MTNITSLKGFKDILYEDLRKWQDIELIIKKILENFGVKEIKLPIFEKTVLFQRGIGNNTDILEKEMYVFNDRNGEKISPRPEATASILRSYIEHNLYKIEPYTKIYTIGPMFRRERPQRGRLRQFHQLNIEYIGYNDPYIDAEIIIMLMHLLKSVNAPNLKLYLNSLGCPTCRFFFQQEIINYLTDYKSKMCKDCLRRIEKNPLRIFDCKVKECKQIISSAPTIGDYLDQNCQSHFKLVQDYLNKFDLPIEINLRMVRGLDYYVQTVFEVISENKETNSNYTIAGGGRYNGLIKELGGPNIPAIGFAVGIERLLSIINYKSKNILIPIQLFLIPLGKDIDIQMYTFYLCNSLRLLGLNVSMGKTEKSLKSQMKHANKIKSQYILIIGEKEFSTKEAKLKNMFNGKEEKIYIQDIKELTKKIFNQLKGR